MHGPCVKVTKRFSTGIDDYYCPRCRPVSSTSVANQSPATLTKTKLTTANSNTKKQSTKPTSKSGSPSTKRRKTKTSGAPTTPDAALESSLFSRPPVVVKIVQNSKLLELSDEILVWILIWVHCQKSICRVSSTCKRLWSVAQDPYLVCNKKKSQILLFLINYHIDDTNRSTFVLTMI
jgi:hypothetical protein